MFNMSSLAPERQRALANRLDRELDSVIDKSLSVCFSNADRVGPTQRHQLKGLLRYYAKQAKPFTACVHDNTKRFGPGGADKVCATLKDIIRGTTHWRGHPELDHGDPGAIAASNEDPPMIDEELGKLLLSMEEDDLYSMIFAATEKQEEILHV
jgi:hypothetical protein